MKIDFENALLFPGLFTFSKLSALSILFLLSFCSKKCTISAAKYHSDSLFMDEIIIEYIMQSHFVRVLKTLSWAPNCSI